MNTRRTRASGTVVRRLGVAVGAIGIVGTLALFGFGLGRDARAIPSPLPGKAASPFALEVLFPPRPPLPDGPRAGDTVRLGELRGGVVVVNFWASWCLACRQEHAALSAVAARHRGRGVRFLGILYQDTRRNADRYLTEMGGQTYATLLDPGSRTAIDFGLYGVPETYIITPAGVVLTKHVGPVTERKLEKYIRAAATGSPPHPSGPDG